MSSRTKPEPRSGELPEGESTSSSTLLHFEAARRLQRMGAVTVGVSLPRTWTGSRGLSVGSAVYLQPLGNGGIAVREGRPGSTISRAVLPVSASEPAEHLFRRLVAAYLTGVSEFVLTESPAISVETRQIARTFARRTVQPEVVSEDGGRLVLRDVARGADLAIRPMLRRMFQLVLDLHRDAERTWDASAPPVEGAFDVRDDDIDRHAWLIERILSLRVSGEPVTAPTDGSLEESLQHLLVSRALERIGDHAVQLAECGSRLKDEPVPAPFLDAITAYHAQVLENFEQAFRVVDAPDATRANEVIDTGEALRTMHATLSERFLARGGSSRLSPMAIASLGLILQSIDRTAAYSEDIAQAGLDRALRRSIEIDRTMLDRAPPSTIPRRRTERENTVLPEAIAPPHPSPSWGPTSATRPEDRGDFARHVGRDKKRRKTK